ncbi:hypothetical protein PIROE2DRAFT_2128 [Piromyces sp. E2]|nr:hypothetical protein PIROE2DRAFT_2128 [Piromyces sp. E2]|eukprot:OUM69929.1 hypothetical protein PIROE2DRAFT_2128 [Piromyces sp. E2]
MVSIRGRLFRFIMRKKLNINPIIHQDIIESIKKAGEGYMKDVYQKGYTFTRKETENKTKYIEFTKDSNQPAKKVLYYMHGGAYIAGLTSNFFTFAYPFCDIRDDIKVVLIDYKLAPEHKYPSQINEAIDLWDELMKEYTPDDIVVGGDSSGGNLAMVLIHKLKKERNVAPKGAFFLSPWTDMTCSGKSYYDNYPVDVQIGEAGEALTKEKEDIIQNSGLFCFIGDADKKDPYISPMFGDFSTFPKSLFIVGSDEVLLDDTLKVIKKIKENDKNEVELINKEGMFHTYPIYFNIVPEGREAHERIREFIVECFK